MKKELEGTEEDVEVDMYLDTQRAILKKVGNWKTPGHDTIHGFWF